MGKAILIVAIVSFIFGYALGQSNVPEVEKIVTKTEYINDPNKVSKTTMESEIAKAKKLSYDSGYTEGYTQGTEYGKSLVLDQIDLRIQEAERTDKNVPLFKVKKP